jgi:spore coat protein A, manganese oxidase
MGVATMEQVSSPTGNGRNRREFLALSARAALALGAASALPGSALRAVRAAADPAAAGLADPALQPLFRELAPNALDPAFRYAPARGRHGYRVGMYPVNHETGLVRGTQRLSTPVFAYGTSPGDASWPGRTFEVPVGQLVNVEWQNNLVDASGRPVPHPIWGNAAQSGFTRDVVDTSLHWCYSLHGYERYSIAADGVPVVVHLHGGSSRYLRDGNPEYFFGPGYAVTGPRWSGPMFQYPNDQPPGNLWYHDHALGITRLNVYAGLAGFYFLRDGQDSGRPDNPLGLPAHPYELAYAIQDRMFTDDGRLFYPSWPGDPLWDDFITDEGVVDPPTPSALAEFFGDHMVVNGKIWPRAEVEPRRYRIHLLNGCDSRFLVVRFRRAATSDAQDLAGAGGPLPFTVIGSDQGLATAPVEVTDLVIGPGERYDVLVDFADHGGQRVIMENRGGDEPFGGHITGEHLFTETDRVMAFDVAGGTGAAPAAFRLPGWAGNTRPVDRVRKLALFEGTDQFGRLQPLLGTAEPATDAQGKPIDWPDAPVYRRAGLVGQMEGSIGWHSPTTENPRMNATEIWEIWNVSADAHPIHLHLVHFEILDRQEIAWDGATGDDDRVLPDPSVAVGDGTYLLPQPLVQHDGEVGEGFRLVTPTVATGTARPADAVERAPKDMVTALPGEVTRIKATFHKPGRYVWHCHILSHEDHEMMRPFEVGAISGRAGGRY